MEEEKEEEKDGRMPKNRCAVAGGGEGSRCGHGAHIGLLCPPTRIKRAAVRAIEKATSDTGGEGR